MPTIDDSFDLTIDDTFYSAIATLILPKHYKTEMKMAKKLLSYFVLQEPILNQRQWKQYILASYYFNQSPIPFRGRLEYVNALLFSEKYGNEIQDPTLEYRKRLLDYRKLTGRKPTKHLKLALAEITTSQYIDQIEELANDKTCAYFLQ